MGRRSAAIKCDVTDREQVAGDGRAGRRGVRLGRHPRSTTPGTLDHVGQFADQNPELWERDLRVNLTGAFNCAQAVWPHMKERGWGRIINMASVAGTLGGFGQASYSTTKAGHARPDARRSRWRAAGTGSPCNAIVPGIIGTEAFHIGEPRDERADRQAHGLQAARRAGGHRERDRFLCSDLADLHHRRRAERLRRRRAVRLLAVVSARARSSFDAAVPRPSTSQAARATRSAHRSIVRTNASSRPRSRAPTCGRELRSSRTTSRRASACPSRVGKAAALGADARTRIPVEYGGGGVAAVTSALIAEELSWGCAGLSAPIGATMFPVRPLLRSGTDEQKRALAAAARLGGGLPRRDRLHRAGRRLRRRGDPGDRPPRRRRVRPERREVLRHERRHRRAHDRLREARRRDHGVPARGGRPGRLGGPQGAEARAARVVHRLDPARRSAHPGRPAARRGRRGLRDRDGLLHALAAAGRRLCARDRARRVRVRDGVRERAARRSASR